MSTFFEDMVNDLNDAIAMEKGELKTTKIFDVPAPTYAASEAFSHNGHLKDVTVN